MRKLIFVLLLSACSPEQSQRLSAMGAAMSQAGQPSAYPVSTLQGVNAGLAGYNGVPLNQNSYANNPPPMAMQPMQMPVRCNTVYNDTRYSPAGAQTTCR